MSNLYRGIIFDMDGTLVDSENLHIAAWLQMFQDNNIPISEHDIDDYIGVSDVLICEDIANRFPTLKDARTLLDEKRHYFRSSAQSMVKLIPGVNDGLERLRHIPKAVATMSSRYEADRSLEYTGIRQFFEGVVTADDVKIHKPDPECYLNACKLINLEPNYCIGIEDSVSGISSSKRAGLFTIGVANTVSIDRLGHADVVFNNTIEVMDYLAGVFNL